MQEELVIPEWLQLEIKKGLLAEAVRSGNLADAERLLKEDVSPDGFCFSNCLTIAVHNRNADMVRLLLSFGADHEKEDILHTAVTLGDIKIILYLILAGSNINARHNWTNTTPLYRAAMWGKYNDPIAMLPASIEVSDLVDSILFLLANGAEVDSDLVVPINKLFDLLGKNRVALVKVSEKVNGDPVYRQADENGNPVKTFQERKQEFKNEKFKNNTSLLVSFSLFKTLGVAEAMMSGNLTKYLNNKDIKNSSEVSAVDDKSGVVLNSVLLKAEEYKAEEETLEVCSFHSQSKLVN